MPSDAFCKSCTVLKGHIGLMHLDGTVAVPKNDSGVYIHHLLTFDMTKRSSPFVSSCALGGGGLSMGGSKFVGSGEDNNNMAVWYTNKEGGHNGGFHINSRDRFFMNADIVSLNEQRSQIYITAELEYLPEIVGADTRCVSLTECKVADGDQRNSPYCGSMRRTTIEHFPKWSVKVYQWKV
jgi:hypothetical protein